MDSIVKTCENCEYEYEDMEGKHCRHCIHNAEEHFEPKTSIVEEQEIRNKAIDEFVEALKERLKGMQMVELQGEDVCPCAETGEECPYIGQDIGCQYCAREHTIQEVDEIAEQMKAGDKDGK